jgi:hypothetical protein
VLLPIFAPNENSYPDGSRSGHTAEVPQKSLIQQHDALAKNEAAHRLQRSCDEKRVAQRRVKRSSTLSTIGQI